MKLRKFEFRKQEIKDKTPDGEKLIATIDYRQTAKDILTQSVPGSGGFSTDEVVKSVRAYSKISDAYEKGQDYALFDDESFQFFKDKVKTFRWGIAHPEIVNFIDYVSSLPETDVEPIVDISSGKKSGKK